MFGDYDGDAISESEWDAAERQAIDEMFEEPIDDDDIDFIE